MAILVNTISPVGVHEDAPRRGSRVSESRGKSNHAVRLLPPAIVWLAATVVRRRTASTTWKPEQSNVSLSSWTWLLRSTSETPESIAENYAKVESIEGFS